MKRLIIFLIVVVVFSSIAIYIYLCINDEVASETTSTIIDDHKKIEELKKQAMKGNKDAYERLSSIYKLEGRGADLFFESMIIANKYLNRDAFFNLYLNVKQDSNTLDSSLSTDNKNKYLAYYCLLKAFELGHNGAALEVDLIFGSHVSEVSSQKYLDSFSH